MLCRKVAQGPRRSEVWGEMIGGEGARRQFTASEGVLLAGPFIVLLGLLRGLLGFAKKFSQRDLCKVA